MKKYNHVIVIGIDGAGAFIRDADTPHFDRIFSKGAVTYEALASNPTISAECWGSMLLGVGPEVHKLTNPIVCEAPYPVDSPFPSLFRRIRRELPDAVLGSYCCWSPITSGIVEADLNVNSDAAVDDVLMPRICDYIRGSKPTFLFVQLDTVDGAGHNYGYGAPGHLAQIHAVDALVGDAYNAVVDAGIQEDTLFMVIADHGGTPFDGLGASHGGWTEAERRVTFAVAGKDVCRGSIPAMNIRDLAAIVLYALGLEQPEFSENGWTAQIPEGIFADETLPAYKDISHLTGAAPRVSHVPHTSELTT